MLGVRAGCIYPGKGLSGTAQAWPALDQALAAVRFGARGAAS